MPFTLIAHQAPALGLKLLKPSWFNGTALVFGSMAPDFEYLLHQHPVAAGLWHTHLGVITRCVPVSVVLSYITAATIVPITAGELSRVSILDSKRLAQSAARLREPPWLPALGVTIVSAWLGAVSHLGLDAFTHLQGVLGEWTVRLGSKALHSGTRRDPVVWLQYGSSVVLSLLTVLFLWQWYRAKRNATDMQLERASRGTVHTTVATSIGGIVLGFWTHRDALIRPSAYFADGKTYVWGWLILWMAVGGFLGAVLSSALCSGVERWQRRNARAPTKGSN